MAGRDGVKPVIHSEVEAHCSLVTERLQASDRQAKCSSYRIDDGLKGIEIGDGCKQFGTTEDPDHRLTVRNIDVGNAVIREESEDVVGRLECDLAGESIGQDSHPNRDGSGNDCPVRGDLGVDIDFLIVLAVLVLLNPAETNKVDGRMMDVSLVEEFNNLGTNVNPQIAALREGHEPQNEQYTTDCPCQVCGARRLAEAA